MTFIKFIIAFFLITSCIQLQAQEEFVFTKQFSKKLKKHQIEFFYPVERWLKLSNKTKDEFMNYDLVLHSPPDIEMRLVIHRDHPRFYPNVEITRTLAHISTNDENAFIEYTQYPRRQAWERYGADLVLYADFEPKASFTHYPNGRVLVLYKEGEAMIKCIILYKNELDPYFKLPMKFGNLAN